MAKLRDRAAGFGVMPFTKMWDLILLNHWMNVSVFPPELLIAIFWEESGFRNIRQDNRCRDASHQPREHQACAVGFGQVVAAFAKSVHPRLRDLFVAQVEQAILQSAELSVEATSYLLSYNFDLRSKDRRKALNEYATGDPNSSPHNVPLWETCERALLSIPLERTPSRLTRQFSEPRVVDQILEALRPSSPAGLEPEFAF
jgi:hypothetical protein